MVQRHLILDLSEKEPLGFFDFLLTFQMRLFLQIQRALHIHDEGFPMLTSNWPMTHAPT